MTVWIRALLLGCLAMIVGANEQSLGIWSKWSACHATCSDGRDIMRQRIRSCVNNVTGSCTTCDADKTTQEFLCNLPTCPVDGKWSPWRDWSQCSATCGGGIKRRTRECNKPTASNGGKQCEGEHEELKKCNIMDCPVDGKWGRWTDWSQCDATCGGGNKRRTRVCDNPAPRNDGKQCIGNPIENHTCNNNKCPVDGKWGRWTGWSRCSVTCGGGIKKRTRECNARRASNGGKQCEGEHEELETCNNIGCPVEGKWGHWTDWSQCSATCGGGNKVRTRVCDNANPSNGAKPCEGDHKESHICNNNKCPVDGKWSPWTRWSGCSSSCLGGIKKRTRECNNPRAKNGGKQCEGEHEELETCNSIGCPVDAVVGPWGEWTKCSSDCEQNAITERKRICTLPKFKGKPCPHLKETKQCPNTGSHCKVNGNWSAWGKWGLCDLPRCSYKNTTHSRERKCNNPEPRNGGKPCTGDAREIRECSVLTPDCPINGGWSTWTEWTYFTDTCNSSTRFCTNPAPRHSGKKCVGEPMRQKCLDSDMSGSGSGSGEGDDEDS